MHAGGLARFARTGLAVVVGLGPGFFLPFALALRLTPSLSDLMALALSVSSSLINAVASAAESSAIAVVGDTIRRSGMPNRAQLRRLVLHTARQSVPAALLGSAALAGVYAFQVPDPPSLWVLVAVLALTPAISSITAVTSGALVANGRTTAPIATQGFRALLPLLACLLIVGVSPLALAGLTVIGELCRFGVLRLVWYRDRRLPPIAASGPEEGLAGEPPRAFLWQFGSSSLMQFIPAIDRFMLVGQMPGSVIAYELADKVSYAVFQAAYNFGLLQRFGGWSTASPDSRLTLYRSDLRRIAMVAGGLSVVGIGAIQLAHLLHLLPPSWELGLTWACIALLGAPLTVSITAATRFIVILNAQHRLLPIMIGAVLLNGILDLLFLLWIGPIGIVVASLPARAALLTGMHFLLRSAAKRTTGEMRG